MLWLKILNDMRLQMIVVVFVFVNIHIPIVILSLRKTKANRLPGLTSLFQTI